MDCYHFELPTTGAISFTEICTDEKRKYTPFLSAATSARASLRATLKESKRTDGEKDYLKLVKIIDDYLPHIYAVISTVAGSEIEFKNEPVFSWRTTLSSNLMNSSPRIPVVGLYAELAFTLLTYGFTLANLARSTTLSLGDYEHDRHITDVERRAKDEKLNFAVDLLSRASGVYLHVAEVVLPQALVHNTDASKRIPELNMDVVMALSHLALADAQNLTIRKLMSKSAYDSLVAPGPPLPKSHPSPALIAKLYIFAASNYASARSLAKTPSDGDVSSDLRKYLAHEATFADALAHKWLGVDAGEHSKAGEAIAFLKWSKTELEDLGGARKVSMGIGKNSENKKPKKSRITFETESVSSFLQNYKKMNDTMHFQPVPPTSELQSSIPAGRTVVASKKFESPTPIFGPGSPSHTESAENETHSNDAALSPTSSYALAGSYF
ncbi:hypothetical protein M422DRAFT_74636 [Sphaerobolus stellatus SS14]|nr:hypothetical protein M422DRAFT_74636 [Sphaerobolus stellatus SS14]